MKLKLKRLTCMLMVLSVVAFTGCGKKDDDVPVSTDKVETPVVTPAPIPEPEPTFEDYFPQVILLGESIESVSQTYDVVEDIFEDEVLRYKIDGINLCDLIYGDTSLFVDDSDIVEKVEFNFFFSNIFGDIVDLQLQDSSSSIDDVYGLLKSLEAVEISSDESNLLDIIDDYNSGKIYNGDIYKAKFAINGMEVSVNCVVNPIDLNAYYNDKGMIIKKTISFKLGDDVVDENEGESAAE